jgi:dolichyl-phosphate-mannose-protein mannosyltransferase
MTLDDLRSRASSAVRAAPAGLRQHALEMAFVIGVTATAGFLRMYRLLHYPHGFHGDEGLTGFDAQRVLDDGWIGPYLPSSLGYPAGYAYWTAFVVKIVGNDDWGVRFSSALLGTLTIPVAYLAFRVMFGYRVAVLASVFFAFSAWHILYSRVAFLPVAWPFIEVAVMVPLFLAVRRRRWYWFGLAGVLAGAGVYSYGSYPIFLVALGGFLLWLGVYGYRLAGVRDYVRHMGVFALGFYVTALSMIQYIQDPDNNYFTRVRSLSLRETAQWKQADGPRERYDIIWEATRAWFEKMTWQGVPDGVDAAGFGPMLDPASVALAAAGLVLLVAGWRRFPHVFLLAVLFIIPWGSILTLDGSYRRCLGMLPALVVAMALPLARVWEWADTQPTLRRAAGGAVVLGAVALVCVTNTRYFFDELAVSPDARFAYVEELAAASRHMKESDPDIVYFLAARWNYNYETRRFLAPDIPGEDRSTEWSPAHNIDLTADRSKDVLFIFVGGYVTQLTEAQMRYPEGRPYNGLSDDGRLLYVAYFVPRHPDAVAEGAAAPP